MVQVYINKFLLLSKIKVYIQKIIVVFVVFAMMESLELFILVLLFVGSVSSVEIRK